jgi:signal transduction histidine kinase
MDSLMPAKPHTTRTTQAAALHGLLLTFAAIGLIELLSRMIVAFRDITKRKRSEEALRESEAKLQLIMAQIPAHIWTTDARLHVLSVMGGGLAQIGIDASQYVGHILDGLAGLEDQRARILAAHDQALHGEPADYDLAIGGRVFEVRTEALRDTQGQIVGTVGLALDRTDRRRMAEQLARERSEAERLAELDRLRSDFIATTSHNLKTPLTAIQAGLGMIETSATGRLRADERQLVSNVRRNTERLGMLINDLLTLNQISAGALRLDREPIDLRTVVGDALSAVHPLIWQKRQVLELDLPEPLPCIGDARRLEQVVVNLLSNAHQHTPTGTRIAVAGHIIGDEIHLSVSDTGPGIQPEHHVAIFDRFHHFSANGGESGLGLAIVRGIVELHGGRIWLESAPRTGAIFHVALPRHTHGGMP